MAGSALNRRGARAGVGLVLVGLAAGLALGLGSRAARGAAGEADPAAVLAAQTNIQTWTADFVQTRTLRALAQPLMATGHVWFAAPNRFRWELGHPPQTIAVRQTNALLVIYPRLKRVERYPLGGDRRNPWQDTLALLEAGFPRSRADLEQRFRIAAATNVGANLQLTLQPRSAAARRMIPEIQLAFATNTLALTATELRFADGSTLRNEFLNPQVNVPVADALFQPKLEPDYKVVEPLKK